MQWATAVSRSMAFEDAVAECAAGIREQLGPGGISLAAVFVTPQFAGHYGRVPEVIGRHLSPDTLFGCSAGGVIGGGQEVEQLPAVSVTAARLPGVELRKFHLTGGLPDLDGPPDAWESLVGVRREDEPQFVVLADPFSSDPEALLSGLDYAFPGAPKIGGLASGAGSPGLGALFLDDAVYTGGTIGLSLSGDVAIDTVVAQGCRPVGDLLQVTRAKQNILYELDGRPAFEVLEGLVAGLDGKDRKLATTSLFIGVVMDEFEEEPGAGDFLIRNLIGIDPRSGAIAVGERLTEGTRVRFHLRDADASAEDLHAVLTGYGRSAPGEVSGALLFSCLGRGEGLYGEPNFDTGVFHEHLEDVPVGGFFCNGEIGPVGGATFLHGYTSSFGLFRPR